MPKLVNWTEIKDRALETIKAHEGEGIGHYRLCMKLELSLRGTEHLKKILSDYNQYINFKNNKWIWVKDEEKKSI